MRRAPFVFLLAVLPACVSTDEVANRPSAPSSTNAPQGPAPGMLRRDSDRVGGVQVFAGGVETALPVIRLDGSPGLTLAFDLLDTEPRPLSVWYYLTDREGRINPNSSLLIEGFERDDLLAPQPSRGTRPPYVHYEAALPTTSTRLTTSGRYLMRVTELGDERAPLFERTFFVAENDVDAEASGEEVYEGGRTTSLLPSVRVKTTGLAADPFYYAACFAQDGHLEAWRCVDRPLLIQPEAMTFQLPPSLAFARDNATHFLDLTTLRSSTDVERVDVDTPVPAVRIAPDQPAFPDLTFPNLYAQPVLRTVPVAGDPGTSSDYVDVTFQMTPPGDAPLTDAYLTGSFVGWRDRAIPMTWNPDTRRYTALVRLKQGQYEYRYTSSDPRFQRLVANALSRLRSRYTSFVFYRDARRLADRLLAVRSFTPS
ncbi:MAG: glycogen-binding domain-containing protein [Bacteroidetes bacterium]|nr:glycogen-binding domain-containing protein [Bacteroidota bacterium]